MGVALWWPKRSVCRSRSSRAQKRGRLRCTTRGVRESHHRRTRQGSSPHSGPGSCLNPDSNLNPSSSHSEYGPENESLRASRRIPLTPLQNTRGQFCLRLQPRLFLWSWKPQNPARDEFQAWGRGRGRVYDRGQGPVRRSRPRPDTHYQESP